MRNPDTIGDFIRQSGDESVHVCRICGKPKLYINNTTGIGFCFVCRSSVKTGEGTARGVGSKRPFTNTALDLSPTHWAMLKPRLLADRESCLPWAVKSQYPYGRITNGLPGVELCLKAQPVGVVLYDHDGDPRYRTLGDRGLAYSNTGISGPSVRVLCEGFFDWINLHTRFFEGVVQERIQFIYTAGNDLSSVQVEDLCRYPHPTVIAFDNDLISVAYNLKQRLSVHFPVATCLPDPEDGKDWDESLHTDLSSVRRLHQVINSIRTRGK